MSETNKAEPPRLKISLPGRGGEVVTIEQLRDLELQFGTAEVRKWLSGGKVIYPEESVEPKNEEFTKHMENLKRRHEQREYVRMMESAMPKGYHLSSTMTSVSPEHTGVGASAFQMGIMGLNMVIGIGCAFIASDYLGRTYGLTPIYRVAVSLTSMIVVMIVEMVLFIIRANKFEAMDRKRQQIKESNFAAATGIGYDLAYQALPTFATDKKND